MFILKHLCFTLWKPNFTKMLSEKANCSSLPVQSRTSFLKVKERFPTSWDSVAQSYLYDGRNVLKFLYISHRHGFCVCKSEIECICKYIDLLSVLPGHAGVCGETQDVNPIFLNWDFSHKPVFTSYKYLSCFLSSLFPVHFMSAIAVSKKDLWRSSCGSTASLKSISSSVMHNLCIIIW